MTREDQLVLRDNMLEEEAADDDGADGEAPPEKPKRKPKAKAKARGKAKPKAKAKAKARAKAKGKAKAQPKAKVQKDAKSASPKAKSTAGPKAKAKGRPGRPKKVKVMEVDPEKDNTEAAAQAAAPEPEPCKAQLCEEFEVPEAPAAVEAPAKVVKERRVKQSKATFARRYRPEKDAWASKRWDALKSNFEMIVQPRVKMAPSLEDCPSQI